jgi:hypothetical protein
MHLEGRRIGETDQSDCFFNKKSTLNQYNGIGEIINPKHNNS